MCVYRTLARSHLGICLNSLYLRDRYMLIDWVEHCVHPLRCQIDMHTAQEGTPWDGVTGQVSFSKDSVRVVIAQPCRPGEADYRAVYNAAQIQCWCRMLASPPREFDVKMTGSVSTPVTEVVLTGALVKLMPLLNEIDSSTVAKQQSQSDEESSGKQISDFRLPCSVWGMVSLLLLLEGSAGMIKP